MVADDINARTSVLLEDIHPHDVPHFKYLALRLRAVDALLRDVDVLEADKQRLESDNRRLRLALESAVEGLDEMLPYVSEYFVTKWGLEDYSTNAKEALSQ